jgi:hypothetical protein
VGKFKGGAVLLVLAIPLALYAAWQVNGVVRTDMIVSDPPADRGAPKEQLAKSRETAAKWATETRKAAAIAWQYRPPTEEEKRGSDATVTEVVNTATARSADLTDLDLFLSGVEGTPFTGKLRPLYTKWKDEADLGRKDEQAVKDWLAKPLTITSAADATRAMDTVNGLLRQYIDRSKFADRQKAENWRVRARLAVIDALAALAETQYSAAVKVKLPLESNNNTAVKAATDTLRGVNNQIDSLRKELEEAAREKIEIEASLLSGAGVKLKVLARQNTASIELLELFARDDLFTNPNGAAAWLQLVAAKYGDTKDKSAADLIRVKVQEFCEAYIPATVRLDDQVIIRGKPALRKSVVIKFVENGETKRLPLSDDPEGLNEFNFEKRYPGETTFAVYAGSEEFPKDMKPTELSKAAMMYHAERKQVALGTTQPKWTAKSVEGLKKKCEAQKDLVDQLQLLGGGTPANAPKIWTRLSGLADGIKSAPELFDAAP